MSARGPFRLQDPSAAPAAAVPFSFDGRRMQGRDDDTLAAALLANGVRTVSRSMKFRRPRGVFSAGVEEPNALLQLHEGARLLLSMPATMVPLEPGLRALSQRGWPSLRTDLGCVLGWLAPLWAAGFYNKTFMWPGWHWYEGLIRRAAGLGRLPATPQVDPDRYEVQNAHCDVLVIGGGPCGLSAACAAAGTGARVLLVEQDSQWGGPAAWDGSCIGGIESRAWTERMRHRLEAAANVQVLLRTAAVGYYDHEVVTLVERCAAPRAPRERYWIVRTQRVVLATGAIEQPLVFCNNDRPGVMLANAARCYIQRHSVAAGRRVVVATNNDAAYGVARALRRAGITVVALIDSRVDVPDALDAEMRTLSIPLRRGAMPVDTRGSDGVRNVTVGVITRDGAAATEFETFDCDSLAVSGGFSPALHLYSQAGGKLAYSERLGALQPADCHPAIHVVGAAADPYAAVDPAVAQAAVAGRLAGMQALGRVAEAPEACAAPASASGEIGPRLSPVGNRNRQWVDLLHDVTVADLELSLRENYSSIEHLKRYTTLGMAVDQGKTSNAPGIGVVAQLRKVVASDLGHTTFRPPWIPVTFGTIAGRGLGPRFAPSRHTPMHGWHVAHGAVIEDFGEWKRPVAYVQPGESRAQAVLREARAVRTSVGLFDATPLGKIEIQGPDALEFLNWFYINDLTKLAPGRVRYGLMLRETGTLFDDGTIASLAPGHFLVTTTSGGAARVASWFEEWRQCEWPDWRLAITPVTDQWATLSLAGPWARAVLSRLQPGLELSPERFPYMTIQTATLVGAPARIYRVSFSGELTYEINVPASAALELWEALLTAGAPEGIQAFGLDALLRLRLEKGFLHIGTDTDGTTVPDDVGFGALAARKPQDFIGRRSLTLPENTRADRLQLVGLTAVHGRDLPVGAHIQLADSTHASDGWTTSACRTTLENESIALAMLRAGRSRIGTVVSLHDVGEVMTAEVVNPIFYDRAGERLHG